MPLTEDALLRAVRAGDCRRPALPSLAETPYVVDREGTIYSLRETPRVIEPKLGAEGIDWVVLETTHGWKRFMAAEIVAHAFMVDSKPTGPEEWTVAHRDGDTRNHAVSNLYWLTRLEAAEQRATGHRDRTPTPRGVEAGAVRADANADERLRESIAREQRLKTVLDDTEARYALLLDALRPFGEVDLPASLRLGHPDTPVVNGRHASSGETRAVTVADFRRAADVLSQLADGAPAERRARKSPVALPRAGGEVG
jgi:hypothetical protein